MFDPHRVGPSSSSYYGRNKGRVIQRKLADPISEPLTRKKLLSYLPIMRLNGIVQTPIVQHFQSDDPTFSFDSDTYLATGSTVTFTLPPSQNIIESMKIEPGYESTTSEYSLSQFQYKNHANPISLPPDDDSAAYAIMIYISYIFDNSVYTFHVEAKSEPGDHTSLPFNVPANSLYLFIRHVSYPLNFQLYTGSEQGVMGYYSDDTRDAIYGVMSPQYFYFDDDRLVLN